MMSDHSGQQIVILVTICVAEGKERLAVSKQNSHRIHTDIFSLQKLKEVNVTEKYHIEVLNRFAALEDLDAEVEVNSAWETEKISTFQPTGVKVLMKNGVFWVVTPCGSCKNRRFGGTWRLLHQGEKNPKRRFLQEPHGVTTQKTPFFIVTAVKTSNLTKF
jgi:hypothetical protein